jgi:RHS repeat-associated protein
MTGRINYTVIQRSCYQARYHHTYYWNDYAGWQYIDSAGTVHPFPNSTVTNFNPSLPCGQDSYPTSKQTTASDGSGYVMTESPPGGSVYSPSGELIDSPPYPTWNSGLSTITDANGNEVSVSTSGSNSTFTDTLGRTALTVTGTGTPSSPVVLSYTAAGGSGQVTMHYATKTVQTSFGCSGISDFGPTQINLVTTIDLQDGETYYLTYEQSPANPSYVTGRISSVTLPTGGTINYTYSGGSNGITCADGSTATLNRATADGSQTYAHTENGTAWTTIETDKDSNQVTVRSITYNFQGLYETERQIGSSETVYTCYNGDTEPCNTNSITLPITRRTVWTTLGSQTSEVDTTYDTVGDGLPTEVDEYNWGPTLSRKTIIGYNDSSCGVTNARVLDRPCSVTVKDGSDSTVASASFSYDGNGNMLTASSGGLSLNFTYNSNGTLATSKDPSGNQTSYGYGVNSCGAFADTVSMPLSLSTSAAWNCDGAVPTSTTDANGKQTLFSYDSMNRLTSTSYPDGGSVTDIYSPNQVTSTITVASGVTRPDTTMLDGMGRVSSQTVRGVTTSTTYDALGRISELSLSGTSAHDTYAYDALGRVTSVTHADGNSVNTLYSSNCATTTDEAGKTNQVCSDALGRVYKVIDGMGNETDYTYDALDDLTQVTEGSQTRTFNYDGLGRLTSATTPESGTTSYYYTTSGGALCSGDPSAVCRRTRPAANQINPGVNTTTTYAYDALNRLTSKSYNDNPQTPTANYSYDQTSVTIGSWSSGTLLNPKGRLVKATTTASGSVQTGLVYSYDPMGRAKDFWQCAPYNCGNSSIWHMIYNYDLAGDVTSYSNPEGFFVTQGVDVNQRPTSLTYGANGAVSSITYTPWGAISTMCGAQGCAQSQETRQYNNRLQPVLMELGNSNNPAADYSLTYSYAGNSSPPCTIQQGAGDNGNITGSTYTDNINSGYSHTFTYCYDAVNRLTHAIASGSPAYDLMYTYDQYGNGTCVLGSGGDTCPALSFDPNTNRLTNIGSVTVGYDAAGNQLNDQYFTYQYDAEGRVTFSNSTGQWQYPMYNALGQRVRDDQGGANPELKLTYPVDIFGQRTGTWAEYTNWTGWNVYWSQVAGQRLNMGGASAFIDHADAVGSTTMETDPSGAVVWDVTHYPSGQVFQEQGTRQSEVAMGLDWQVNDPAIPSATREYNFRVYRWLTPDPMGGDVTNPQSLNRYAYVLNNPTTLTDPLGLYTRGECDIDPLSPDCGPPPCYTDDWNDCNSCDPILGCPGGYGGGHGGRGGRYGGGGGGSVSSAPPAGQPPLVGGVGFISPNDAAVWQQIEQQYPWIYSTVWACAFAPVCQEVLGAAAAGAAVGVAVGYGVAKLQNYIHQVRGQSDPVSVAKTVNPGRDASGNCNPCPEPPPAWEVPGSQHGSTTATHWHWIEWNQDPLTCTCYSKRKSGASAP